MCLCVILPGGFFAVSYLLVVFWVLFCRVFCGCCFVSIIGWNALFVFIALGSLRFCS